MSYYIARTIPLPFEAAMERAEAALKDEGFGVITRIDIRETLKEKIGVDFQPYAILGACNPKLAHKALQLENKVGTLLPCNVVVQQTGPYESEVAVIDPVASMGTIDNPELRAAAQEARDKLQRAIDNLE